MNGRLLATACLSAALLVPLNAQTLSDAQVIAAIASAKDYKPLDLTEFNLSGATGYRVFVYSPTAWIKWMALMAKQEFRTLTAADVSEDMRADLWRIRVYPSTPTQYNQRGTASSVTHVVLRNEKKTLVIQPEKKEPFDHTVGNALGATLTYTGLDATFPTASVRELWGPTQDQEFIVSVVGPNWTYDFTIKKKHFKQLQ